jgi:glycosyltransferase involved in cell wall biosynthesis
LRAHGFASEIFAEAVVDAEEADVHPLEAVEEHVEPDATWLIYQASAYTVAADVARDRVEPLVVNYHNVTPASFFALWEPTVARDLERARSQIRELAGRAVMAISDSTFNDADLADLGYRRRAVVPVLIDVARLGRSWGCAWPERPGARWLFVGRLCPNKAQHDMVTAFVMYRRLYDRRATLFLVGRSSSHRYESALRECIDALGLSESVRLLGTVPDEDLGTFFATADVFVCLSEHEGFCNTAVEAMAHDLPVVAFASTALPRTIGGAGLLLSDKSPAVVAEAVSRVMSDAGVRRGLVEAGRSRHRELSMNSTARRICEVLDTVIQ